MDCRNTFAHMHIRATAGTFALCLAVTGCIGSSDAPPVTASDGHVAPLVATIESIQARVFSPHCVSCHSGSSAPQGLRLENAGMSYANLVDVASSEVPVYMRVAPGDPDASYLIHKLEGTQAVGDRMPRGADPLSAGTIAVIRQWIAEGAAPPGAPPEPDLDSIQARVFTPRCHSCHSGDGAPQGLRLDDAATSHAHLVNVASTEQPQWMRVKPGSADDSYLVHKLEGTQAEGDPMPRGGEALDAQTITAIRQWINDGAAASATPD